MITLFLYLYIFANRNYGQLSLAPYNNTFEIPTDIIALIKGELNGADFLGMTLNLAPLKARRNPETYHESFTTKLFFEEAKEWLDIFGKMYMKNARIQHFKNDLFELSFGSDVRIQSS